MQINNVTMCAEMTTKPAARLNQILGCTDYLSSMPFPVCDDQRTVMTNGNETEWKMVGYKVNGRL